MKNLLLIIALFSLAACNTPEKLLCRSWRLSDVDFDAATVNLTAEEKPLMVQQLRDSCLFTFNKDNSYLLKLPQNTETGEWRFSSKHDTLFTANEHTGAVSKINVLNKMTLDIDVYSRDGMHMKFILAPLK